MGFDAHEAHLDVGVRSNADLQDLAQCRDDPQAEIDDTVGSFTDEDVAEEVRDAYATRE